MESWPNGLICALRVTVTAVDTSTGIECDLPLEIHPQPLHPRSPDAVALGTSMGEMAT